METKTDEGDYLENRDYAEAPPEGIVIIGGVGFKILPMTLGRLKKVWPVCQRIRGTANDPVAVFLLVLKFIEIALVDDGGGYLKRRQERKKFRKMAVAVDREKIQAAYEQIMDVWFKVENESTG